MVAPAPNPTLEFQLVFGGTGTPTFSYDKTSQTFSLSAPLAIGTLEDIAQSGASVLGDDFPDTSNIPVLGALMNKISFTIESFSYTEATTTQTDAYSFELKATTSGLSIGAATLTSADIQMAKTATNISS